MHPNVIMVTAYVLHMGMPTIHTQIVMYMCVLFEYDHLFLCFLLHLLFGVITSTQKVSYHVRMIASDVITDPNLFRIILLSLTIATRKP